jgi:starch synthase
MRILMVASEALPFEKTGGLADVVGSLPPALAALGHTVEVVMPFYRGIAGATPLGPVHARLGLQVIEGELLTASLGGARAVFVRHDGYFDRDYVYGAGGHDYADNAERFAFLSSAALAWAATQPPFDVVHAHDWQAGLVPLLMVRDHSGDRLGITPSVFTVHNVAFQGIFDSSWLPRLGLGWELFTVDALEYWGRISFLKAGVNYARTITTVSPRYATEIQTPESGFGFDGILRRRREDLVGILNGIDYDRWDPARDPHLPEPFDAATLTRKAVSKRAVLGAFGLPVTAAAMARPLVAMISRMVDQKGHDLLAVVADELARLEATLVVMGEGNRGYEDMWLGLAARHPDRIAVRVGYEEGLAHLIHGGADLFLMPSRFEPCGLSQMYAQRYGTVPLVRATGGLFDTVRNLDQSTGEGTGFTFDEYSPQALLGTLRWALSIYPDRALWERLQQAGMRRDFSWAQSAREYVRVYERAMA